LCCCYTLYLYKTYETSHIRLLLHRVSWLFVTQWRNAGTMMQKHGSLPRVLWKEWHCSLVYCPLLLPPSEWALLAARLHIKSRACRVLSMLEVSKSSHRVRDYRYFCSDTQILSSYLYWVPFWILSVLDFQWNDEWMTNSTNILLTYLTIFSPHFCHCCYYSHHSTFTLHLARWAPPYLFLILLIVIFIFQRVVVQ
jgi:hypothetical protein